jgi:hypothetical protein
MPRPSVHRLSAAGAFSIARGVNDHRDAVERRLACHPGDLIRM